MEETLGKRIAFHRKRLNLTQDALAEQLGITAQAVSKWENDQSCPDIGMLPKLAELFDVTTDELLGMPQRPAPIEEMLPEETAPSQEAAAEEPKYQKWKALTSPGAAFGFWLFLTGMVAVIDALQLPPHDLADIGLSDIAICCGIFTFGLSSLFRRFSLLRLGCTIAGGVFVFTLITEPGIADMDWYVPLVAGVALLGLDMLIAAIRKPRQEGITMEHYGHMVSDPNGNHCTYDGERFDCATCFGSGDRQIQLPHLSGGSGEVTFGELIINLSRCAEIANGCEIALKCAFGSLEILVHRQYRVEAATSSAFGSVDVKGAPDPSAETTIYLKCNVSFGQITIRHI